MKSEADVRCDESECFGGINLIVYQGIANIFHQAVKSLGVLRIIEEIRKIVSGHRHVHSPANIFEFPGNPRTSGSVIDLTECGLTVPVLSPSLSR